MKNLATIQEIKEINPIPNADNIEVATVMGWKVVVKKGEFKPGDLCVFIEIDSLVPKREWSKFLFDPSKENEYHRLRTVKLRKQISQGLALPLFPVLDDYIGCMENDDEIIYVNDAKKFKITPVKVGDDVTEYLGIKKYEKPVTGNQGPNKIKTGNFPHFLRKTDEVRIQSNQELLEELKGKPYYITQKLDGTSATYYKFKGNFGVCSRNLELFNPTKMSGSWKSFKLWLKYLFRKTPKYIPPQNLYWRMANKYNIKEWLPDGYAIQGEIVGPGIQGNKLGLEKVELFIFNVWDIKEQKYLGLYNSKVNITPELNFVPCVEDNKQFNYTQEELLKMAEEQKYPNGSPSEGIVVRSIDQTISFKVINNKFALEYGE